MSRSIIWIKHQLKTANKSLGRREKSFGTNQPQTI